MRDYQPPSYCLPCGINWFDGRKRCSCGELTTMQYPNELHILHEEILKEQIISYVDMKSREFNNAKNNE